MVDSISGVFKFKNVGEGILKVDPPQPGCDCTESKVRPDTLAPGESGEIIYTVRLDRAEHNEQKYIRVHSNDPQTPLIELTMQMDYTPLYELSPLSLWITLPPGKDTAQGHFTITRTDGKPLQINRITTSQNLIHPAFDSSFKSEDKSALINVTVHRPAEIIPMVNATVQLWDNQQLDHLIRALVVTGEIQGELIADPSSLYWVIPDFGKSKSDYAAGSLSKTIALKSVLGNAVEIKNATSTVKGLNVQVVSKDAGKKFDLVLKFDEVPQEFSNGKVTIETSVASLPKLEVPLTVAVPSDK